MKISFLCLALIFIFSGSNIQAMDGKQRTEHPMHRSHPQSVTIASGADGAEPQTPSTRLYTLPKDFTKSVEKLDELEEAFSRTSIFESPTSTHSEHETFGRGEAALELPELGTDSEPANDEATVGQKRSRNSQDGDNTPEEVHTPKFRRRIPTPIPISVELLAVFFAIDQAHETARSAQQTGNTPSAAPSASLSDVP